MDADELRDVDGRDILCHQQRRLRPTNQTYLCLVGSHHHFHSRAMLRRELQRDSTRT